MPRLRQILASVLALLFIVGAARADAPAPAMRPSLAPLLTPGLAGASGPVSLDRLTRHTEPIKAFNLANITDVVAELGFTSSVVAVENSFPLIIIRDERDAGFALQPMVCEGIAPDDDCHGLLLIVALEGRVNFPGISVAQVNRFNDLQFYGRGHVVRSMTQGGARGQGMAILSRLVLSDYGTTRGNLGVEITTFRSSVYNYANYLSQVRVVDIGAATSAVAGVVPFSGPQGFAGKGGVTGFAAPSGGLDPSDGDVSRLIGVWQRTGVLKDLQASDKAFLKASPAGK